MGQVTHALRKTEHGYSHWCQGCEDMHYIPITAPTGPNWTFDGNLEKPTFNPSVHLSLPWADEPPEICHYWIKAGQVEFYNDSTHLYRGQKVPLPSLPEHSRD